MLNNKNAVIYGGGGAIGGAIARAFAREGARVFIAGRGVEKLEAVARDTGAETAVVDALDEQAVAAHADEVARRAGGIDVAVNAVGMFHVQATPFMELALDDFLHPIVSYARANFVTARAVARHMKGGVVMTLSTPGSQIAMPGVIGFGSACAATEAFTRLLAAELAPAVRVVCLRPDAIPEAAAAGSHSREVFRPWADAAGVTVDEMLAGAADSSLLKRMPTLAEVADTAAFIASDSAGAMTGTVVNLSCGSLID